LTLIEKTAIIIAEDTAKISSQFYAAKDSLHECGVCRLFAVATKPRSGAG